MVNLGVTVSNASKVRLDGKFKLYGDDVYTIATNSISWGEGNYYAISDLVFSLGKSSNAGLVQCGESFISPYDFGLIYCVMCVMVWASKTSPIVTVCQADDSSSGYRAVWLDSQLVTYNKDRNNIICVSSGNVVKALRGDKIVEKCFTTGDEFTLLKQGDGLELDSNDGSTIRHISASEHLRRTYPKYFQTVRHSGNVSQISNDSQIGVVLGAIGEKTDYEQLLLTYKNSGVTDSDDARRDLIFTPVTRYSGFDEFCGSRAYSDIGEIVLPVNWHNGLLVYIPWFSDNGIEETGVVEARVKAALKEFYNITDECNAISSYALTVPSPPNDCCCYPVETLLEIKDAFMSGRLNRVSLAGAIGKNVIAESVMISSLITNDNPYELYSFMPVGAIGDKIIIKTPLDRLVTCPYGYTLDECYYDISEVI